jgi:Uma2 family endonuclease
MLFLKGKNCNEFGSNLRLHVPGHSFYTYPDILVIYGEPHFRTDTFDTVTNPSLIAEILSEGTADYDKGLKFDLYRYIQSRRNTCWLIRVKSM